MTSQRLRIGFAAGIGVTVGGVAALVHRRRSGYAEEGYQLNGELDARLRKSGSRSRRTGGHSPNIWPTTHIAAPILKAL
jgi:hypothetical protein